MELKKVDTLFHGTKRIEHLISILKNGFYSSYADEEIAGRKTKIMMVSFSNVPLIESRSQVNYGQYFIGLTRKWGIEKGLQPVAYTYGNSSLENNLWNLLRESALGQTINLMQNLEEKGASLNLQGSSIEGLSKFELKALTPKNVNALENTFKNIHHKVYDIVLYLKSYVVINSSGKKWFAFNDREWRYIPPAFEEKIIFESDASGEKKSTKYIEWSKKSKPHYIDNPLQFRLDDIEFVLTKSDAEIADVYQVLFDKYSKGAVIERITRGALTILSMDKITKSL